MIPYEIDPTLHSTEPLPAQLDDGFSPPPAEEDEAPAGATATALQPVDPTLWAKSAF